MTSKDWIRILIAFIAGVLVTLAVITLTGGSLYQGLLSVTPKLTAPTVQAPWCGHCDKYNIPLPGYEYEIVQYYDNLPR